MTGFAFVLFTFYMVPDPGTTPSRPRDQVCFGAAVAAVYGLLQVVHVVYGLFFALAITCALRGASLWAREGIQSLQSLATLRRMPRVAMRLPAMPPAMSREGGEA
jgi:hypothetical protein